MQATSNAGVPAFDTEAFSIDDVTPGCCWKISFDFDLHTVIGGTATAQIRVLKNGAPIDSDENECDGSTQWTRSSASDIMGSSQIYFCDQGGNDNYTLEIGVVSDSDPGDEATFFIGNVVMVEDTSGCRVCNLDTCCDPTPDFDDFEDTHEVPEWTRVYKTRPLNNPVLLDENVVCGAYTYTIEAVSLDKTTPFTITITYKTAGCHGDFVEQVETMQVGGAGACGDLESTIVNVEHPFGTDPGNGPANIHIEVTGQQANCCGYKIAFKKVEAVGSQCANEEYTRSTYCASDTGHQWVEWGLVSSKDMDCPPTGLSVNLICDGTITPPGDCNDLTIFDLGNGLFRIEGAQAGKTYTMKATLTLVTNPPGCPCPYEATDGDEIQIFQISGDPTCCQLEATILAFVNHNFGLIDTGCQRNDGGYDAYVPNCV